jgi:hypothetical protein
MMRGALVGAARSKKKASPNFGHSKSKEIEAGRTNCKRMGIIPYFR